MLLDSLVKCNFNESPNGGKDIGSGYTGFAKGLIDDVAIFNHALSLSEVQLVMNDGAAVIPEPITLTFLAIGGMALLRHRKA